MNILLVVGGIFSAYFVSLGINWLAIQILTSADGGPFGIENRVFNLVINRDYLELDYQKIIIRLCHWGGFLLWVFFVYVFIKDILSKIKKNGLKDGTRFLLSMAGMILALALMYIIFTTGLTPTQETTTIKIALTFLLICVNLPLSDRPMGYNLCIIWSTAFVLYLFEWIF